VDKIREVHQENLATIALNTALTVEVVLTRVLSNIFVVTLHGLPRASLTVIGVLKLAECCTCGFQFNFHCCCIFDEFVCAFILC